MVFFVLLFAYGAVGGTAQTELGRIDAAIDGQSQFAGKAYFFEGDRYIRYDWATDTVDPGYPKNIAEWNLPSGFTGDFDAVLNGGGPYSGKAYFFKGDQYVRYDWATDKVDPGYPKNIAEWNLPSGFTGDFDAAIDGQSQFAGKAYFFEGDQYIRYDWATDKVDPGYPKNIAEWNLPSGFTGDFDAVLNGGGPYSGKAYFFKGNQYVRYDWAADKADPGYPKPISGNWDGITVD